MLLCFASKSDPASAKFPLFSVVPHLSPMMIQQRGLRPWTPADHETSCPRSNRTKTDPGPLDAQHGTHGALPNKPKTRLTKRRSLLSRQGNRPQHNVHFCAGPLYNLAHFVRRVRVRVRVRVLLSGVGKPGEGRKKQNNREKKNRNTASFRHNPTSKADAKPTAEQL